jgi:hypothetical protein
MKTTQNSKSYILGIIAILFLSAITIAQVGINTTNPAAGSMLDITSVDKGMLIPRVDIANLSTIDPITGGSTESLLVYNTNITTGKGFYFWNGTIWIPLISKDWKTTGNSGTSLATDFIGTTDNVALSFRTNNIERLRMTTNGDFRLYSDGTAGIPILNWDGDTDTGFFRAGANQFGLSTGGTERLRIPNANQLWAMANGTSALPFYTWNGDTDTGFYRVGANQLGISTNGTERLRFPNANQIYAMSNGTSGAPFYSWSSDTDSGFYSIGANTLGLSTNGTERMRLLSDGRVTVNDNNPFIGDRFTVLGAAGEYVINAYANTGFGVFTTSTGAGIGLWSNVNNAGAIAVVANNDDANGSGIIGTGANGPVSYLPGSGGTFNGPIGGSGFASTGTGTGLAGAGNGATTVYTLASGSGTGGSGNTTGIYGVAINTSGVRQGGYFTMNKSGIVNEIPPATDDPTALLAGYNGTDYFGGYFDGNQDNSGGSQDYAYVGIRTGGTNYKIIGGGNVSTIVNDRQGNKRVLFAPEAPEILFEDYGTGQLVNGTAHIDIDPILSDVIHVSSDHPLKVFIQLEGDCNGVYVTNKTAEGFTVKELNQGRSNVPFSWHIVANRADTYNDNGTLSSRHVNVRFPIGPERIDPLELKATNALNTNRKTQSKVKK